MAKRILHLRGSKEEYERYGVTVGDGELALERRDGAPTRIKIGDGKTPYSELPYFGKSLLRIPDDPDDTANIVLHANRELIVGLHSAYELILPEVIEEDYECALFFRTSICPPAFTYPQKIVFIGDECEGGMLRPAGCKGYALSFKLCDGTVYATVRSAPLTLAYESYGQIEEKMLPAPTAVMLKDGKNLLDISLAGYFHDGDTDGYIAGLGSYVVEEDKFSITVEAYNAHLLTFAQLKSSAEQYTSVLSSYDTENGFAITLKESTLLSLITSKMLQPLHQTQYRIRCRVRLLDEESHPAPGSVVDAPFAIRYYDQKVVQMTMTAQADGTYQIDFLNEATRRILHFCFCGLGKVQTVEFLEDTFSFCAEFEGIESPAYAQSLSSTILLDAPLLGIDKVRDTLSLNSMIVTRRVYADFIENPKIHSTAGDFTVFYIKLPVPMAQGGEFFMEDFERIDDPEMLPYSSFSYYVNEADQKLLFSGDYGLDDVSALMDYICCEIETSCFAYERETPVIEKSESQINFRHFEDYMVLRYKGSGAAKFILKQYSEREES